MRVHLIPLDEINESALPRDRSLLDHAALDELKSSIAADGLRQPVELYRAEPGYALISGYRRLMAFRDLNDLTGGDRFAAIPAFIRKARSQADAITAMVAENDQREDLCPWDKGRIAVTLRDQGYFDTLDAAIAAAFPHANRQKRARLRAVAEVAEALPDVFAAPEDLSQHQIIRLANCLRLGWHDLIVTALEQGNPAAGHSEWSLIAPTIRECETLSPRARARPNRPKRLSRPYKGVTVRREIARNGYVLHITGRNATSKLVTEVIEQIETWLTQD